jgi:hypothetical protein
MVKATNKSKKRNVISNNQVRKKRKSRKINKSLGGNGNKENVDLDNNSQKIVQNEQGTYKGQVENGFAHGYGSFKYFDGSQYNGNWVNGKGQYLFNNGDKYVGDWKDGKKHGKGIYKMSDGTTYEGNFENDKREGWGKLSELDDDGNLINYYEGSWKDDRPDETSVANPYLLQ